MTTRSLLLVTYWWATGGGIQDIAPVAVSIGKARFLVKDPSVNTAAQMFDEVTVD